MLMVFFSYQYHYSNALTPAHTLDDSCTDRKFGKNFLWRWIFCFGPIIGRIILSNELRLPLRRT